MWLMKVMRQGSELHGLASYINKYNELCFFRWGIERQRKPGAEAGLCRHYAAFLVCADERARISLMRDLRVIASLCRVDMVFIAFPRFILWY